MSARWEIVHTKGQPQPWHVRLIAANGRILMSSETYGRRQGAMRCIDSVDRILYDAGEAVLREVEQ